MVRITRVTAAEATTGNRATTSISSEIWIRAQSTVLLDANGGVIMVAAVRVGPAGVGLRG